MKRSEALDLIKKQWNESTSFPTDQAVAEYILSALEKAGMLPPLSNLNSLGTKDNAWEPEDEA